MISRLYSNKSLKLLMLGLVIILCAFTGIKLSQKTSAQQGCTVTLNPDTKALYNAIPETPRNRAYTYFKCANTYPNTPAFRAWIAKPVDFNQQNPISNYSDQNISVKESDTSVRLSFSYGGVVGWTPSHATKSNMRITGAPSTNLNSTGDFSLDYVVRNVKGRYDQEGKNFMYYAPPGGFPNGRNVISVNFKHINEFTKDDGSKVFQCIGTTLRDPIYVNSLTDFSRCGEENRKLEFWLSVERSYNITSHLVRFPRSDGSDIPDANQSNYRYNGQKNAIINSFQTVQDTTNKVTFLNADGNNDTRVYAPDKITLDGTDWYPTKAVRCNVKDFPDGCRNNGGFVFNISDLPKERVISGYINRRYVEISSPHPNGDNMRVYWYYQAEPALTCNMTSSNDEVTGSPITLTWTSTGATRATLKKLSGQTVLNNPSPNQSVSVTPNEPTRYVLTVFNSDNDSASCSTDVSTKPFLKIFTNDAAAGSSFTDQDGQCSTSGNGATFIAFNKGSGGGFAGAGAELALFAVGEIDQVASANTSQNGNPKVETFANSEANNYGGNSGVSRCIPDFFEGHTAVSSSPQLSASLAGDMSGQTLYVDGDVFLNQPISYSVSSGNKDVFKLFVKGDIYIGANVNNLDGFYVAQPDVAGAGGNIYTCATGVGRNNLPNSSSLYGVCKQKITVHGALIAKSIKPWRTNGTLNNATTNQTRGSADVAEEFIFAPELYLNPTTTGSNTNSLKYDSIYSLPPVF